MPQAPLLGGQREGAPTPAARLLPPPGTRGGGTTAMSTTTATTARLAALPSRAGLYPVRQLGQVPTFVAGVLTLVAVLLVRPTLSARSARDGDQELARARRLLDQPDCSPERLQTCLQGPLSLANRAPLQAGEAHFLLGSAY